MWLPQHLSQLLPRLQLSTKPAATAIQSLVTVDEDVAAVWAGHGAMR
jgi:hypothetical protein